MAVTTVSGPHPARFSLNPVLANTMLVGGVSGIAFIVLMVAGIVLQGNIPTISDSIDDIRDYWTDSSGTNRYLLGDWLTSIAMIGFFLPFLTGLRSLLGPADPSGGTWARLAFVGGIVFMLLGALCGLAYGGLAIGAGRELDDSTLRFATGIGSYAFATYLPFGLVALVLPSSLVILASGVAWRWTGYLGLATALLAVVGALWVISGDEDNVLILFSYLAGPLAAIWVISLSVAMLRHQKDAA